MIRSCTGCSAQFDYEKDGKTYSHEMAVVIPEVYDGTLFWVCPWCGHVRHCWPEGSIRRRRAEEQAAVFGDCGMASS